MLMKIKHPAPQRLDRKADILLAAEKLFAQRGYHAVSIRDIAQEAGVPLALVGYHYGPKHELFHAIFAHWNSTIEERLLGLKTAHTLPRIIDAFVGPVLRMRQSSEGEYYALLVARELFHVQDESDRVLRDFFDPLTSLPLARCCTTSATTGWRACRKAKTPPVTLPLRHCSPALLWAACALPCPSKRWPKHRPHPNR